MYDRNNPDNLFQAIEQHFTEAAEDRWRRFALEMIERSPPDIVAAAFAAAEIRQGNTPYSLPDVLIAALKAPRQ